MPVVGNSLPREWAVYQWGGKNRAEIGRYRGFWNLFSSLLNETTAQLVSVGHWVFSRSGACGECTGPKLSPLVDERRPVVAPQMVVRISLIDPN
jgi:hypothetical protein